MSTSTVSRETADDTTLTLSVLIVTPDEEAGRELKACLVGAGGFAVSVAPYLERGSVDPGGRQPEVVLVASKEAQSALSACKRLRLASDLPIVVCSPNARQQDIVRALESGADDYVSTPVQPRALAARLHALLRRSADWSSSSPPVQPVLGPRQVEITLKDQRVFRKGEPLELSTTEFRLLASLMRRPGRVVTHAQLLAEAWGPQYVDSRNYLRLYIQYLREKIEDDPRRPRFIINEWGVGYRFEPSGSRTLPAAPRAAA